MLFEPKHLNRKFMTIIQGMFPMPKEDMAHKEFFQMSNTRLAK